MSKGIFGAATCDTMDGKLTLVVGGSTSRDVGNSATDKIMQVSRENFNGFSDVFTMKTKRTFSMPILTNSGRNLFIIGGTTEPIIDMYDMENRGICDRKIVKQLEDYLFFELGNYSTDFTLSACAFA